MAAQPSVPLPQPAPYDDKLAALDSIPLFMRSLPAEGIPGAENDVALEALRNLAYEGTPDEIAQNFKDQGNEYFRGRRFREAMGFYSQGIDAKPEDIILREALLCNRAACNLELQNYGQVLRDASLALTLNPRSSKALYRSALALTRLSRYDEALDACERCLAFDAENDGVKKARAAALKGKEEVDRKERERIERIEGRKAVDVAVRARGITITTSPTPPPQSNYPSFDPTYSTTPIAPPHTPLIFPVFLLYPQYATSDLISSFSESATFADVLGGVFPPNAACADWDKQREYSVEKLNVYVVTRKGRILRITQGKRLLDVWPAAAGKPGGEDGLEMKDGCLSFVVLPKGEVERKWIAETKAKLGNEK